MARQILGEILVRGRVTDRLYGDPGNDRADTEGDVDSLKVHRPGFLIRREGADGLLPRLLTDIGSRLILQILGALDARLVLEELEARPGSRFILVLLDVGTNPVGAVRRSSIAALVEPSQPRCLNLLRGDAAGGDQAAERFARLVSLTSGTVALWEGTAIKCHSGEIKAIIASCGCDILRRPSNGGGGQQGGQDKDDERWSRKHAWFPPQQSDPSRGISTTGCYTTGPGGSSGADRDETGSLLVEGDAEAPSLKASRRAAKIRLDEGGSLEGDHDW